MAGGFCWWGWHLLGEGARLEPGVVLPLAVLGLGGVLLRERNLGPHLGVSVSSVVLAAAVALVGPVGAALVGMFAYLCDVRQQRLRTRLFNAAMAAAIGAVGGVVYLLLADGLATDVELDRPLLDAGLPLAVAHGAMTLLNAVSIGLMANAVRGSHVLTVAGEALRTLGWGTLTHLVVGFLFVVLWVGPDLGALSALFVLGPLVVAHWSIGREALARREHQETVTTFVAALEEADPVSVGHSARVADLADRMAGILDLGGQQAEDLRYAALLHDIGLVAVRPELPTDVEPDDIAYLSAISGHPEAGVAVLKGMDFLTGALPAIAHHHERFDGRGYPAGLEGETIPLAARIIAVADAYDALTTDGAGTPVPREEALAEIRSRAGTQFDPQVVDALAEVLSRAGAQPVVEEAAADPHAPEQVRAAGPDARAARPRWDHDHPSVSDTFAEWQPDPGVRVP
ncbi:hypothetical protein GCM10009584_09630 [Ornithinimicrobium humiphilum]|uniref:HD domain-containing protein n=1 Tax=Ornithinimicrobium humiphilum TaxID=125288 RepID=A0A543KQW8_9MICO|nr:HD domain-containing phosphohydrolase [Ornithinimicrobium humiphilum]TQM97473.1 HD domain-containing protein [Ornithinimicrobium humiphilum]